MRWNDAIGTANGTKVANDYASKKKFADKSITEWQPWMGVVFNPWGAYEENGHIGMLASWLEDNNGMKWYRVVSANYGGDEKLSKDFIPEALIKSNGGFIPTKPTVTEQKEYDVGRYPQYREYIEDGKLPAGMKDNTRQASVFRQEALEGYTAGKNSLLQKSWLSISDDKAYMSTTVDQRKAVDKAVQNINPFITTMDKLIELTKKYGNESTATPAGKEMEVLVRNAQLLAKEIYNLWVLNWPDLELMQSIIANPTNRTGIWNPLINHAKMLEKGKKTILDNAYSMGATVGITPVKVEEAWQDKGKENSLKAKGNVR